jgi:hypothetical protein
MVRDMFVVKRGAAPNPARGKILPHGKRIRRDGERGSALVEFALVMPIFLIVVFGMCSLGFIFNQYLALTEAVNIGGEQLALARGNYADPCKTVAAYVEQASPTLSPTNMTFTFTINGTPYAFAQGATGSALSCSSAASPTKGGYPVILQLQYACGGVVAMAFGSIANFNPMPASSCILQSQITEISQ